MPKIADLPAFEGDLVGNERLIVEDDEATKVASVDVLATRAQFLRSVSTTGNMLDEVKALNKLTGAPDVLPVLDNDGAVVGCTFPAHVAGDGGGIIGYPLKDSATIARLAGKTILLVGRYVADEGFLATKGLSDDVIDVGFFAGDYRPGLRHQSQIGTDLLRIAQYRVTGDEAGIGMIARTVPEPPTSPSALSLRLVSLAYGVLEDSAASLDEMLAAKAAQRFGVSLWAEGQPATGEVVAPALHSHDPVTHYVNGITTPLGANSNGAGVGWYFTPAPEDFALLRGARIRLTCMLDTHGDYDRDLLIVASGDIRAEGGGFLTDHRLVSARRFGDAQEHVIEGVFGDGIEQLSIGFNDVSDMAAPRAMGWSINDVVLEIVSTADKRLTGAQATLQLQRNILARTKRQRKRADIFIPDDFPDLEKAIAGVVAHQVINVREGDHDLSGAVKDSFYPTFEHVHVRGVGVTRPRLIARLADSSALTDVAAKSASDFFRSARIENLRIVARNRRYGAHIDSSNANRDQHLVFTGVDIEHEGNADVVKYQQDHGGTPDAVWTNCAAVGFGGSSGSSYRFAGGRMLGYDFDAFYGHNSANSEAPMLLEIDGYVIDPRSLAADGGRFSVFFSNVGSGQPDRIWLTGNTLCAPIGLGCWPWMETDPAKIPADKLGGIQFGGHGNSPVPYVLIDEGSRALRITSASTGTASAVVLSGTAANKLFGTADKRTLRAGAAGIPAQVTGFFDVGDHLVGPDADQDVVRAGKRVVTGDSLTVKIDALAAVTIPMVTDIANADLVAAIQAALGTTAKVDLVNVNDRYRPTFPDQEMRVFNGTGAIIPARTILAWTSAGRPYVRAMTPSDPASAFAGIAYGADILPGSWGRAKNAGQVRVTMDLLRSDGANFNAGDTFGVSTVDGRVAVNAGAPIMTAINAVDVALLPGNDRIAALETAVENMTGLEESVPLLGLYADLVIDSDGRPVSATGLNGKSYVASNGFMVEDMQAGDGLFVGPGVEMFAEIVLDSDGRFVSGIGISGEIYAARGGAIVRVGGGVEAKAALTYGYNATTALTFPTESNVVYLIVVMGQSLAGGFNSNTSDNPVTTAAEHAGYALMPGVNPWPEDTVFTTFSDLHEVKKDDTHNKESICSGMADAIMRRMQADLGFKPQILFANCAWGGTSYAGNPGGTGLKEGGIPWRYLQNLIVNARLTAAKQGKRLEVLNACILLGEQDTTYGTSTETYRRGMSQWHTAFVDIVRRLNPEQARTPLFFLSQTDRPKDVGTITTDIPIATAQLTAPDRNQYIRTVGSLYWGDDSGDEVHPSCRAYRRFGQMFGHVICEDQFGRGFEPLKVKDAWWASTNKVRAQFTMPLAIETSDTLVKISDLGAGKGINFDDGSGSPPAISGIALVGGSTDTIEITLAAQPTGLRQRLLIANRGTATGVGRLAGGRTGIRSAASYGADPQDAGAYDLYHWACKQVVILPVLS